VADPATDLLTTIPNTPGDTVLREVRLVGDHDAYDVGAFAIPCQGHGDLAAWPGGVTLEVRAPHLDACGLLNGQRPDQLVTRRLQTMRGSCARHASAEHNRPVTGGRRRVTVR
jgi:hypothetical protein